MLRLTVNDRTGEPMIACGFDKANDFEEDSGLDASVMRLLLNKLKAGFVLTTTPEIIDQHHTRFRLELFDLRPIEAEETTICADDNKRFSTNDLRNLVEYLEVNFDGMSTTFPELLSIWLSHHYKP